MSNPWITGPGASEATETPVRGVPAVAAAAVGAAHPQRGGVPAPTGGLTLRAHSATAPLWWVGTHGGAAESALAGLVPGWTPADHAWLMDPDGPFAAADSNDQANQARRGGPLPYTAPPEGLFPDVRDTADTVS